MQGNVLSPCLFNIFIDDIKEIFDESCDPVKILGPSLSHLLYADDLILIAQSAIGLQNCLSRLFSFCEKWKLNVNLKKSNVMIFNHTGLTLKGKFQFGDKIIPITNQYCYLGIEIKPSGSFETANNTLAEKARKAMMPLISTLFQFKFSISKAINLFHSYIRPIALYNSEIIGLFTAKQTQNLQTNQQDIMSIAMEDTSSKLHLKYLKFILGVSNSCSNLAVLGETGQYPLMIHGLTALITNWYRLENKRDDSLGYLAYQFNKRENLPWYQTVSTAMNQCEMGHILENPNCIRGNFRDMVKIKLHNIFVKYWYKSLKSNRKLNFYSTFKKSLCFEKYLDIVPFYKDRKLYTKFRCSDHNLEIEKGRHYKLAKMMRICKLCQKQVETEKHYLVFCLSLNIIREKDFSNCW